MANNIFEPLINSVCECVPVALKGVVKVFDIWGNFIYRIIEGVPYGSIEVKEDDIIQTDNISKYEYIPVEQAIVINKTDNVVNYTFVEGEKDGLKAFIGYTLEGNLKEIDMLEGHIIAGGASRWGKSNFLNLFITNIMKTYTPKEVLFGGCDFKMSDIYYFRRYNHFKNIGVSTNVGGFLEQIEILEKEVEKRAKILDEANCRNAIKYNKKYKEKMTYIIFVIDELVQLMYDKKCRDLLHNFMSKSASYGIYFILASQDFTKDTIGKCKMNTSQTIGFHTHDETDSITIMGKGCDLQDINIVGRCKIKNSKGIEEVQVMYISEEEIEATLKPCEKQKV